MDGSRSFRKSCDFCYLRKIKCDGQKPRCSHCIIYSVDCTYAAPSRRYKPKKRKDSTKVVDGNANLQNRVRRLEAQPGEVAERSRGTGGQVEVQSQVGEQWLTHIIAKPSGTATEGSTAGDNDSFDGMKNLPPLQYAMPIIQIFLEKFNAVLPLFHAETLFRLTHRTYKTEPRHRDPVEWAAINVVLALTLRQGLIGSSGTDQSTDYLHRAQSVLPEVVLGETKLLNVQVLVGMVMLLQASQDLQPSLVLVATTMRLAHKLGLHSRASSAHLDLVLARERACVFWMAYILDKDISIRANQPSIQLDDDIDLDLSHSSFEGYNTSSETGADNVPTGVGIITTVDGLARMNYFVTRIQLAVIEGGVYDYLYSTRAQNRTPEERSHALESVARALDRWRASVPPEFSGAEATKRVPPEMHRFLCVLHATSLSCKTLINQAHAWSTQWMSNLSKYDGGDPVRVLPSEWESSVHEARDVMVLSRAPGVVDRWNFWILCCSYITAMVLLTASSMHRLRLDNFSLDEQLVSEGLQVLDGIAQETQSDELRSFHETCAALHRKVQQKRSEAISMANTQDLFYHFLSN
ncbi:hypothetical protein K431DRAFT_316901 [Polychaeton citri CBS 116435]|uniref:Zn(2)-C6 fungal-type domain-containing protein n=1 Tax=Polychaeton citri CBS 116435 TaxID=1314669 RepID=A0A9P4PY21_9PEZI|nr:hypothetical protein K431DRAFT_316901 [Polychaeton citri CBS 116435]